jgi:hypothetical protein
MKSWKTLVVACIMAALMAAKPALDATGYHFDAKTITEIVFAVLIAVGGVLVKDFDVTGPAK